jgi:hypothetical protein
MGRAKHLSLEKKKSIIIHGTTLTRTGEKRKTVDIAYDHGVSTREVQTLLRRYRETGDVAPPHPFIPGRRLVLRSIDVDVST